MRRFLIIGGALVVLAAAAFVFLLMHAEKMTPANTQTVFELEWNRAR